MGGLTELNNLTLLCRYHHTPISFRKAGAAASMPTGYRNGSRPAGLIVTNAPRSMHASDASTPYVNSTAIPDDEDH
jgi:hypothetical protein